MGTHPHQDHTCGTSIPQGVLPEVYPFLHGSYQRLVRPRRVMPEVHPSRQESYQRCFHSYVGSYQRRGRPDEDPTRGVPSPIVILPDVYISRCWPLPRAYPSRQGARPDLCPSSRGLRPMCIRRYRGPTRRVSFSIEGPTRCAALPRGIISEGCPYVC